MPITFDTANDYFLQNDFLSALKQYRYLSQTKYNSAFSTFMVGKCLHSLGNITEAYHHYQKAKAIDDSNPLINREIEQFIIENNFLDETALVICHFFPYTPNIGDSGSAAGIRYLLQLATKRKIFFISLSCRNTSIEKLNQLAKQVSGYVIGGGGLFFNQPSASGWYFPLTLTDITHLQSPVITYAPGFNKEYTNQKIWNLDQPFLSKLASFHQHFSLKSVRDLWSKKLLEQEGVTDLHLTPCPSAYLKPLSWYSVPQAENKKIIGIALTSRALPVKYLNQFLENILAFANWLKNNEFYPLFIFHDSADDLTLINPIKSRNYVCIIPQTSREAVTIYNHCFAVVGMRGHSLILAAGQNVPLLAISYNQKIDAFMELLELPHFCLSQEVIFHDHDLITKFKELLVDRDLVIDHLKNKNQIFYQANKDYCKKILKTLEIRENENIWNHIPLC